MQQPTIPCITGEQMCDLERLLVDYGLGETTSSEIAGHSLASLALTLLGTSVKDKTIIVASGTGYNGAGGLVAARYLWVWGAKLIVWMPAHPKSGAALKLRQSLERFGFVPSMEAPTVVKPDLIIDALNCCEIASESEARFQHEIQHLNSFESSVLALDIPSGLDPTTGKLDAQFVRATHTLTLELPKTGFLHEDAKRAYGELYLASLGVPTPLLEQLGITTYPPSPNAPLQQLKRVDAGFVGWKFSPW
jgi:ADP-dependent NAD(P)H-hydrate dehydratase / NAD(P)H-hydrate epimerase